MKIKLVAKFTQCDTSDQQHTHI